ncbi:MAG: hypothetical protein IJ243_02530 [Prevotella sp.]|nr:hypothetical protein [Prevotella sp.]
MTEVNAKIKTMNDADVYATIGCDITPDGEEQKLAYLVIHATEGKAGMEMNAAQLDMLVTALTCIRRQIM